MKQAEFIGIRKKLSKTQKEMATLLGTSIKAIHSYEQGWRSIPPHVERQMFFLVSRQRALHESNPKPCWIVKNCPPARKKQCPSWEFRAGQMCWFINGNFCECSAHEKWRDKMELCRECEMMVELLKGPIVTGNEKDAKKTVKKTVKRKTQNTRQKTPANSNE